VLTAQSNGYKVNLIYPDDYGIHFYSDTLYATDDYIAANPDLVLRFLRATLKGWTYAIENPNLVAPMVAKYNPNADLRHETAQMTASLPLVNTGEDHIGWMKPEIWAGMEKTLRDQSVLTTPLDVTQVYTMQFLEEIYGK
jgi:NitT/TauT family transport system substrate-binding protein